MGDSSVQLKQEPTKQIRAIMDKIPCPFDFQCCKSGFEDVCGGLVGENGKLVDCVDEKAAECGFAVQVGSGYVCSCPLRLYIARTFKK